MANKNILILGGTQFVGRSLVEMLSKIDGFDITLFNRGKSNPDLFSDINQIHGNRETDDILQVCNQHWDCVIDFSGYYPATFKKLLGALKGKVGRYIFISTISVYDLGEFKDRTITEADEIHGCTEAQKTSKLPDAYGEKKAEMERILLAQTDLDKIILRPSFIYGRYDWTERFYYWLYRAKFSEQILVPADFKLSLTYAADLVNALFYAITTKEHREVYNTISQSNISLREVVEQSANIFNRNISFVEASDSLLQEKQIDSSSFPLYVSMNLTIEGKNWIKDFAGRTIDFDSALRETIRYHETIGWHEPRVGLKLENEREILGI